MANSVAKIYDPHVHPHQAKQLCETGMTNLEIANFFQVSEHTIYRWCANYPEFSDALVVGKEKADDRVERALYNRAVGYTYESEKIMVVSNGRGLGSEVVRVPVLEHVPPDVKAAELWLRRRRPEKWDPRPGEKDQEARLLDLDPIDYNELTPDEAKLLDLILAKSAPRERSEEA